MIPKDVNLQQASAALDKMATVARAFEDARKVMDVLLNAEQVVTEIRAQTEKARKDLDVARKALAVTRETSQTLQAQAKAIVVEANDEVAKARRAVKAYVTRTQQAADAKVAAAEERAKAEELRATALKAAVEKARVELDGINEKIAAAKKAAREMLS